MPKQRKQTLLRRLKACIAVATVVSMTGMQSIAYALPAGGVVSAGDAAIVAGIAQMDIHQASSHAVLDWNSFNIAQGEGVTFYQPSSSAIALNRIHDINPSTINGNLTANGNVWLLNTQGVMFGQSAVVNVGGLLATTADISNEDFMQENYVFDTAGDPDASVVNEGTITIADHGLAALVAPKVRNSGTIRARLGKVELASGDTFGLDLYGDGLLSIEASDAMVEQIVEHTGLIEADGGVVTMTAGAADSMVNSLINMEGTIVADSVGGQEGEVVLYAAGSNNTDKTGNSTVLVAGDIKARGNDADEKGGKVTVTGDHVGILAGAEIDASGQAGGGTVLIGGDYQGQGDTPNAKRVIMQDGANIYANALGNGDGGKVILWADDRTDFAGYIEARGGPDGGDGGFVETSGKNILSSTGLVDASSPNGNAGTWLLDPNNITIQAAGSDTNVAGAPDFTTSDDSAIVTVGSIETALNAGTSVTITTGTAGANAQAGDITVADAITKSGGGAAGLTLTALGDILLNATISSSSNALDVTLRANNSIITSASADITSNGGHIVLNSDRDASGAGAIYLNSGTALTSGGGNITLGGGADPTATAAFGTAANPHGIQLDGASLNAGSGNIIMRGEGHATDNAAGIGLFNSSSVAASGNITLVGTGGAANASQGVLLWGGSNTITATGSGAINITGTGVGTASQGFYLEGSTGTPSVSAVDGNITINGSGTASDGGVFITWAGANAVKTTGAGNINISGTHTGGFGMGVNMTHGSTISTTGTGNIGITGNGNWESIRLNNAAVTTGSGNITFTDSSGAGVHTVSGVGNNFIGGASTSGTIKFVANTLTFNSLANLQTSGNIWFQPLAAGNSVGIAGGAGDLQLTSALLNAVTSAGSTTIGRTDGSALISASAYDWSGMGDITLQNGSGGIALSGAHTFTSGENFTATTASGNITSGAAGSVTVGGAGAISLTSGGDISFTHDFDLASGGGAVTLRANNNIVSSASGDIDSNGGHIVLNSDRDASGAGRISLASGTTLTSGGGNITLGGGADPATTAARGYASNIEGVVLDNAVLTAGGGNIIVRGQGHTIANGIGVSMLGGADIITSGSGTIEIVGAGGGGTGGSHGVSISGAGTTVVGPNISITGTGGTSSSTGTHGVYIASSALVQNNNAGAGTFTIHGTGGSSNTDENVGVYVTGGADVTTDAASLTITGLGGTGSNSWSSGIVIGGSGTTVETTGTGNLALIGTGRSSGSLSSGVDLYDAAIVRSTAGANGGTITITGTAGGDGAADTGNNGILFSSNGGGAGAQVYSRSSTATITLTGIMGAGGSGGYGIYTDNGTNTRIGDASTTANIIMSQDTISRGTGTTWQTSGNILFQGYSAGTTIGIAGGAGGLQLASALLNAVTAGSTTIGRTDGSGLMDVRAYDWSGMGDITLQNGSANISMRGAQTFTSGKNFTATTATGDIISGAAGSITTAGIGTITLDSGDDITFAHDFDLVSATGAVTLKAKKNIAYTNATNSGDITTSGGNITIQSDSDGAGGGSISFSQQAAIASGGGNILLSGGANAATGFATGITMLEWGDISSGAGNIDIRSSGGMDFGTSGAGGLFFSSTSGNITLLSTNTSGTGINYADSGGAGPGSITTTTGNISLTGTGGAAGGGWNQGIVLDAGMTIASTNGGTITLSGTGGSASEHNWGIVASGAIITGSGGAINITGAGGAGTDVHSDGILADSMTLTNTGAGAITLTGTSGASSTGMEISSSSIGNGSTGGDITLIANSIDFSTTDVTTTGNIYVRPYTDSTTIGVAGATGTLNLSTTELNRFSANTVTIGRADGTGLLRARGWSLAGENYHLALINGSGNIQLDANTAMTMAANKNFSATTTSGNIVSGSATNALITTSGTGTITLDSGGDISLTHNYDLTSATGAITLRAANNISSTGGGDITSGGGHIVINSDSDASGSGAINLGSAAESTINSGGGNITMGGGADPTATAAIGNATLADGINIRNVDLTAGGGNISLRGQGHSGGGIGVDIVNDDDNSWQVISTTGAGTITITGTGGGAGNNNRGVALGTNSFNSHIDVSTVDGAISITGTGGASTGDSNSGILMVTWSNTQTMSIESTGTGTISLIGQGGGSGAGSSDNHGIEAWIGSFSSGMNITGNNGNVTLQGTGGNTAGGNNIGFFMDGLSDGIFVESTGTGDVIVTGTGGGTGAGNYGISLNRASIIRTTGSGDMDITATGVGAGDDNIGLFMYISEISLGGAGALTIDGTGSATGTGAGNFGVYVEASTIESTSTGTIEIIGQGGAGDGGGNHGVYLFDGSDVTTVNGNLVITGTGGSGTGDWNDGVAIGESGTTVESTGTGNITITGQGGGSGGAEFAIGVNIWDGAIVRNTAVANGGTIAITGTGGTGSDGDHHGIMLEGASGTQIYSRSATSTITLTGVAGTGGANNIGFFSDNTANTRIGDASTVANITMIFDTITRGTGTTWRTTGDVWFRPYTDSTTIGIGGGAGGLQLTTAILNATTAGSTTIGRTDGTGLITAAARTWTTNGDVTLQNGTGAGSVGITFTGSQTLAAGENFTATTTTGNIISGAAATITTSGAGTILLSAGNDLSLTHDFDLTTGGGTVTARANNNIVISGSGDITSTGGHIVLNSDRDASGAGRISLGSGTFISSGGGNITLGGGADPTATAARGYAGNVEGVLINASLIDAGGGNVIIRGQGHNAGNANYGIYQHTGADIFGSTITMVGTGGAGGDSNIGVFITGIGTNVSANQGTGTVSITGTGAGTGTGGSGISIASMAMVSAIGDIILHGTGSAAGSGTGMGVSINNSGIVSGGGNTTITGIAGAGAGSVGIHTVTGANLISATADLTLNADTVSLANHSGSATDLWFNPYTDSTTVGIAGGAGTLQLTAAVLDGFTISGSTTIGRTDGSGLITTAAYDWSGMGDILLQNGSAGIVLSGAHTFTSGENFTATTVSGDITSGAAGSITTGGAGTILLSSGNDFTTTHDFDLVSGTGAITVRANNNVVFGGSADITSSGGHIVFNSDRDASGAGRISLDNGTNISSGGGNITMGGGADPTATAARGYAGNVVGVLISGTNLISAGGGNISIRGQGHNVGDGNVGVYMLNHVISTTGSGSITIVGTGGAGGGANHGISVGGSISTVDGNITLMGTGGAGSGAANAGIVTTNSTIESTGTGNIALTGQGGLGGGAASSSWGMYLYGSTIRNTAVANGGTIILSGTGGSGSGGTHRGIFLGASPDQIYSRSATSTITLNGIGGTGGANNYGLYMDNAAHKIGDASTVANIIMNQDTISYTAGSWQTTGNVWFAPITAGQTIGTAGGAGSLALTSAILDAVTAGSTTIGRTDGSGLITTAAYDWSGMGDILLQNGSAGIVLSGAHSFTSGENFTATTVSGDITSGAAGSITTGGAGTILLASGNDISFGHDFDLVSGTGAITVRANNNVVFGGSADITSSGGHVVLNSNRDAAGTGAISVGSGSVINSGGGNITLGGGADPTMANAMGNATINHGVYLNGATLSAGDGNILLRGTGHTGDSDYGVYLYDGTALSTTGSGNITISGLGLAGDGDNDGVGIVSNNSATTISTVDGNIEITGQGGASTSDYNDGIYIWSMDSNQDTAISSSGSGNITLTGTGGGAGGFSTDNNGVVFENEAYASVTSGTLTIVGTGGIGDGSDGIQFLNNGEIRSAGSGAINLTGIAGSGTSFGIKTSANSGVNTIGGGSAAGDISLVADSISLADLDVVTTGDIIVKPYTSGTSMGIGTGAGTLSVTDTVLAMFNWGANSFLKLGDGAAGAMDINSGFSFTKPVEFRTAATFDITQNAQLTSSYNGTAVVMAAGDDYHNAFGATALNLTGGGRWLIYSERKSEITKGSLNGSEVFGESYASYAPGDVTENGNVFIYSVTGGTLTFTIDDKTRTYGAANPVFTYVLTGLQGGDTEADAFTGAPSITTAATSASNVGDYDITGATGTLSLIGDYVDYAVEFVTATLSIDPATLTVTADAKTKVYGALDPALTYGAVGYQNGEDSSIFTGGLTRVAGETVAGGPYAINQGTLSAGANYTIVYNSDNLTITPYGLAVTADAKSKTYGAADPALTYVYGALQNGDDDSVFSGGLTRVAGETVAGGPYAINQGTLSAGSNYTIIYTGDNLTINPYTLAVTADAKSKVYGAADPTLTYIYGALQNGDDDSVFTGGLTRVAGETVAGGPYAINQGTLSAGSNYTISYTGDDLTITPYALTVNADAKSKVYGAADPTLTYIYGALQNGDDDSVFTGGLTRVAGETVAGGPYAINQGTLSAGSNYTISYTGEDLTITPYALSVTADAKSKTYGAADPALTYIYGALQNGDDDSVFSGGLTRVAGETVAGGPYAINQGTLTAGSNYTINYTSDNLTINPYTLVVTADAKTKVYGAADPAFTYVYGALQNGDDSSVFSGSLGRVAGESVAGGPYAINQGTLSAGSNYAISYTGDNLTITPYTLSVTANAMSKIYGAADPTLTYIYGALQNGDNASVFSGSMTRVAGETVAGGPYAISQGTLTAGTNYTINYTGSNFTINPYTLAVVADAKSKTEGAADPALTYTYGALRNGDNSSIFSGGLDRAVGESVGTYAIGQGTLLANSNYIISYTGANFLINAVGGGGGGGQIASTVPLGLQTAIQHSGMGRGGRGTGNTFLLMSDALNDNMSEDSDRAKPKEEKKNKPQVGCRTSGGSSSGAKFDGCVIAFNQGPTMGGITTGPVVKETILIMPVSYEAPKAYTRSRKINQVRQ